MAASALHTEFLSIGAGVSGYLAKPSGVPGIGVVVMMEAFGLNAFVKGVCERFARAGYMALAPDLYHGDTFEYTDRERAIARVNEVDDEVAMREVGHALDMLVAQGARDGRLAVMALAMALSYSGTGILIAAAGLLLPTNTHALRRTLALLAALLVFWLLFRGLLNLDVFLDRATEFDKPNTSGYARFVAPMDVVQHGFASSWWAPYIGNGPGTIQPAIIRYTTTYAIHDPTWAKLLFEYGILGFSVMVGFAVAMVRRSAAPVELKIAVFYTWFAAGGMLLNPDVLALLFGLSALWRAPSLAPVQAAPRRFAMARAA